MEKRMLRRYIIGRRCTPYHNEVNMPNEYKENIVIRYQSHPIKFSVPFRECQSSVINIGSEACLN